MWRKLQTHVKQLLHYTKLDIYTKTLSLSMLGEAELNWEGLCKCFVPPLMPKGQKGVLMRILIHFLISIIIEFLIRCFLVKEMFSLILLLSRIFILTQTDSEHCSWYQLHTLKPTVFKSGENPAPDLNQCYVLEFSALMHWSQYWWDRKHLVRFIKNDRW